MRLGENVTNKFILKSFEGLEEKFNIKYNNKFDYSKAVFLGMKTKIEIICPEHGIFWQIPETHLCSLFGCKECASKLRKDDPYKLSLMDFKARVFTAQGANYDLSKITTYTNIKSKYTFRCVEHNIEFDQNGADALLGKTGCKLCKNTKIGVANSKTQEEWLEQAIKKHGTKFGYDKAVYLGDKEKITIKCPHHGYFEQTAGQHLVYGCDKCARDAVNVERYKDTPTIFYTFEYKGVYKIGITTKKSAQIRYYKDIDDWENTSNLIEVPFVNFPEAYMFEQFLINNYQEYRYWGDKLFNKTGITEVFTKNIYEMYLKETLQ